MMSTFFMGYRQIRLAHTIENIVKSQNLITETVKKKSEKMFAALLICLNVYFLIYFFVTLFAYDGDYIVYLITSTNIANCFFDLTGLFLYLYTIRMLRSAIAKCASFQFETKATYVICALYTLLLLL